MREHLDRVRGIALDAAKLDPSAGLTDVERCATDRCSRHTCAEPRVCVTASRAGGRRSTRTWYQGPIRLAPTVEQLSSTMTALAEGGGAMHSSEARLVAGQNALLQKHVKTASPYMPVSGTLRAKLQGGLGHSVEIGVHNAKIMKTWNAMRVGAWLLRCRSSCCDRS